jgi:hypothetical protein
MLSYFQIMNTNRFIHTENTDIPESYRKKSLHIALECADKNKDWETFSKLFKLSPEFLKYHLDSTNVIFDYNYLKLTPDEQEKLFKVSRQ